jgi:sialate O-acetylesterase
LFNASALANIKLPKLVGNGIVLQRQATVKIWGWAGKNEPVTVQFLNQQYVTAANNEGQWQVELSNLEPGGPYQMQLISGDTITLNNILVGDVWLCSGQSNMDLPMRRVSTLYGDEMEHANNPFIHYFAVPQTSNLNQLCDDVSSGQWVDINKETIAEVSAVAYLFGKELYAKYQVPIGLIRSSYGGSPIETWMSEEAVKPFPEHYNELLRCRDTSMVNAVVRKGRQDVANWYATLNARDMGYRTPGMPWYKPDLNADGWNTMPVPGYWSDNGLKDVNGVVWYRKAFEVPSTLVGKKANLNLGRIVDADSVFVNGTFVGTTSYQYPPRRYTIPANILKAGSNTIVVRVINSGGRGGFVPDYRYEIVCDNDTVNLKGNWLAKLGAQMPQLPEQPNFSFKATGLFNAMIRPVLNYAIKGAIWYQGESNTGRPQEYASLLPALINDWRSQFQQPGLPFLIVQLPNFGFSPSEPGQSNWAMLREAQLKALALPNTGLAVTIELGQQNDLHPLRKREVGQRLALQARKVAYHDKHVVASGPLYQSMSISKNQIVIRFSNVGKGLLANDGGELKQFAIAGSDKKFVWAKARIKGNKLIVWSDQVDKPVAVRYAWADNPSGANLYNREGLPASPFRTDNWDR